MNKDKINEINLLLQKKTATEIVEYFIKEFSDKLVFATSMGAEDQILTDMICKINNKIRIFTLDTGRLFPETYSLIERTNDRYDIRIELFFPNYIEVEKMVKEKGINLFYNSIENRKECCHIRKIEPLKRAFKGSEAWICGLRKEQSVTRKEIEIAEWDEQNQLVKINPLYNWTEQEVWDYIKKYSIPYNKLHDQGFSSIGCQPCTRAIKEGEDVRAGRWWWENPDKKECGLHAR